MRERKVSELETIDASLLRAFVASARHPTLTAAAASLSQPKSTISKALRELERQLGLRLFERSSRRLALTPAGQALLSRAEIILSELQQFLAEARAQSGEVRGRIRIAAPPELGTWLAGTFVREFLRQHPTIELSWELSYSFENLLDPAFDVAFRLGSISDDRLVAHRLGAFHRSVVASPDYLHAAPVNTPEELASRNCLIFSGHEHRATWTFQPVQRAGRMVDEARVRDIEVSGNLAVHSFTALLQAAIAGTGITRVPDFLAREAIASGHLQPVLPQWTTPTTEVFIVHRLGQHRIRRIGALIAAAREQVPRLLASDAPTK